MNFTTNRQKKRTRAYGHSRALSPFPRNSLHENNGQLNGLEITGKPKCGCITMRICHVYRDALPNTGTFQDGDSSD